MRRYFPGASVCLSVLVLLAACGDTGGGNGQSEADLRADFVKAADALAAKTGAPGEKDSIPPASDPAVQAFNEQSARAFAALGTDALPIDGFESYADLCGKSANIVGAYVMAGTQGSAGAAQQQKMESNLKQHFDAMFTPLLFSARCGAAHLPFLEGQYDPSDASKAGAIAQVRDGMYRQVAGLIEMSGDATLQPERRRQIVDMLAADASKFAVGLSKTQRQNVVAGAQQLAAALPQDLRPQIEKFRTEVAAAACGKICSAA